MGERSSKRSATHASLQETRKPTQRAPVGRQVLDDPFRLCGWLGKACGWLETLTHVSARFLHGACVSSPLCFFRVHRDNGTMTPRSQGGNPSKGSECVECSRPRGDTCSTTHAAASKHAHRAPLSSPVHRRDGPRRASPAPVSSPSARSGRCRHAGKWGALGQSD